MEGSLEAFREAYASSLETWMTLQQTLPSELKQLAGSEAEARLEAAATARTKLAAARRNYLERLRAAYLAAQETCKRQLEATAGKTMVDTADEAMLADVDKAAGRVDEELSSAPASDLTRIAALKKQKADLLDLRGVIERRNRDLNRYQSGLEAVDASRQAFSRAYGELAGWVGSVLEAAKKDEAIWTATYADLRSRFEPAGNRKPVKPVEPESAAPPVPAAPVAPAPVEGAAYVLVPSIGGIWVLGHPGGANAPHAAPSPVTARLQIAQTGVEVRGSYECSFGAAGESKKPDVRFSFSGRITNPIFKFDIGPPLNGYILIRQADAGELEVSYRIANARQAGIRFGQVPDDAPQILRKALR